jgi:hypothetical protein
MNILPPGPNLNRIVHRILAGKDSALFAAYSTIFAACEPALEWLADHVAYVSLKNYKATKGWRVYYEIDQPFYFTNTDYCKSPAHAIALAVFAVGVAKGIVDEKGNLR